MSKIKHILAFIDNKNPLIALFLKVYSVLEPSITQYPSENSITGYLKYPLCWVAVYPLLPWEVVSPLDAQYT